MTSAPDGLPASRDERDEWIDSLERSVRTLFDAIREGGDNHADGHYAKGYVAGLLARIQERRERLARRQP